MSEKRVEGGLEVAPGIRRIRLEDAAGWGWNTVSVDLPQGGILLYSPAWFGAETFRLVEALGEPKVLVLPNSYHHLALRRYREQYPSCKVVCSDAARPRLEKQGYSGLLPVQAIASELPAGSQLWFPEGTKTGEVWLSIPTAKGTALLVCDAVFNLRGPLRGIKGALLRALQVAPGLKVSRTYKLLAIRDAAAHLKWFDAAISKMAPAVVLPSHGEPFEGPAAVEAWVSQTRARLG